VSPSNGKKAPPFLKLPSATQAGIVRLGLTGIQHDIVGYVLWRTLGTGRIASGAVEAQMEDEGLTPTEAYEDALAGPFACDCTAAGNGGIAAWCRRDNATVALEVRHLLAAGILREHSRPSKGHPRGLSVDLDPRHWRPVEKRRRPQNRCAPATPPFKTGDLPSEDETAESHSRSADVEESFKTELSRDR
jgi:hypothetical protein